MVEFSVTFCIFRLSDNGEGHIQIQFKYLSTDEFWRPQVGEDILEIFKLDYDGQQILPPGTPDLVNPSFKDDNYIQLLSR